jgi:hypothetical protein
MSRERINQCIERRPIASYLGDEDGCGVGESLA